MAIESIESALIGSLLVDPDKIIKAAEHIKATDFTNNNACVAYGAIMGEWAQKKPVNLITIAARVPALAVYLSQSTQYAFPPSIGQFAFEIAESARLRRIRTGIEAASKEQRPDNILSSVMDVYRHEMRTGDKSPVIADVLGRFAGVTANNRKSGKVGFSTGINALEENYIRLIPGHIWTIGGFTSVGKTATIIQMICNLIAVGENAKIVVISTEMTEEQVVARIISNFTGIPSFRVLSENYHSAEEADAAASVKDSLAKASICIYDSIYQLTDIETVCRKADMQGGVNVVVVDYVQNCRWSEAKSQYQEQSEMAKRFQALAKEIRATIICLSQVSNDVGRGNTDQLELKGAGEWAAVSDVGIMLSRHKTEKHRLKLEVKKNRHGALCECEMEYKNLFTSLQERKTI